MPPERVPDPLRQKFLPHDGGYQLDYSKHIDYPDGCDCEVKYLMNCTGEFTHFVALYFANSLSIRQISEVGLESHYLFNEELSIQDIGYFRNADDQLCLLVALNSTNVNVHPHCVAFLWWSGAKFQLMQKVSFEQEICCLKVIADEQNISQLTSSLHQKMAIWPHIIAVGTHFARCYLFHFPSSERYKGQDPYVPIKIHLTDGLKPFRNGDEFVYSSPNPDSGYSESKRLNTESVSVTCISFLEKCRVVLVGFSFGGIMSISLTVNPTIDPLMYPCSAPVQFIAPLEPDDDPRMHVWFFVAYRSTKAKPLQLCLYEVMFPEEESLPLSERTWIKPRTGIKLVIPFHNSTRWVSLQTLVRDRSEYRGLEDSSRDSTRFGSEKDRSVVFFSYIANDRSGGSLKGGLFDLNAYFYKRLIHAITHDGTIAQQCAFMSTVQPIPMHYQQEDFSLLKDVAVDPNLITRFISNVSDAEQMFYPSALEVAAVHVAGSKKCYQLSLPSLPNQLLSTICADLDVHMTDPTSASAWLTALGFYKSAPHIGTHDSNDYHTVLCLVLSTLVSHQRAGAIVHYIRHTDSAQSRHLIAAWIWEEIDKASKKLHETIEPLFARFSGPLNPAGRKALAHVHDVFVAGVQILRELVSSVEREQDETKEYLTTLEARRFATESLRSYSTVIHRLMFSRILPVAEDREIRLAMGNLMKERRAKASGQLNIDKLVSHMQRKCPTEPFWHAEGPQWYPPALLNLLSPILVLNIPTKWKGQLLAFYLLDYANCRTSHNGGLEVGSSIIDTVKKQMHGILGMSKSDIQDVYKMWCADGGQDVRQEDAMDNSLQAQQGSSEAEAQKLLNIPRPLTSKEEDKLKSLLKSTPFGEFTWNCYLAKHRRFNEVVELSIPSNAGHNEAVLEYQQLLPIVKTLRRSLPYYSTKNLSWPSHIKEAIEKFETEKSSITAYESDLPIFNRGKTPVRLPRRLSKSDALLARKRSAAVALQQLGVNSPQLSSLSDKSPPVAKRALMNLSEEDVIIPEDIPINTLNNIADILRTPKARACAAAHAESQRKWTDKTPEAEVERPAPRSILKSGKTAERATQPRNRLQFNLPPSLSSSTEQRTLSEASNPELVARMAQPNFDESFEYGDDTTNTDSGEVVEVQDEPFEPLVSPDLTEDVLPAKEPLYNSPASQNGDALEHSVEVQDEEDEVEQQVDDDGPPPLVEEEEQDENDFVVSIEEQPDLDEPQHGEEAPPVKHIEEQEEWEQSGRKAMLAQKGSDEVNNQDAMEVEELDVENSVELQEESHEVRNVVRVTRLKSAVKATVSPPPSSPSSSLPNIESTSGVAGDGKPTVEMQSNRDGEGQDQYADEVEIAIERQSDVDETGCDGAGDEQTAFEKQSDDLGSSDTESLRTAIETQSDVDEVVSETQEDDMDATFTVPASPGPATGDFVSVCTESVTIVGKNSIDETSNLKLVDYSFGSNSTFDHTQTPKKLLKDLDDSTQDGHANQLLDFDDELAVDSDQLVQPIIEECSSEAQSSPQLPSSPVDIVTENVAAPSTDHSVLSVIAEVPELVTATPSSSPQPSESDVASSSTRRKARSSAKKGTRAAQPVTPTRQSQRLRQRSASVEIEDPEKGISQESIVTRSSRKTRQRGSLSGAASPTEKESANTTVAEGSSPYPTRRSLRQRTPSVTEQEPQSSTPAKKTPRRSRKANDVVEENELKEVAKKSPSRAVRTRKVSTTSSEASSSVSRTPTRRTPTRSVTKSKFAEVEQGSSKRKSILAKAAKVLDEKFTMPKQLGGIDAGTLFDMTMKGTSSRRRSLSDSGILEVKAKRSKVHKIDDAIVEAEEESESVGSGRSEPIHNKDVAGASKISGAGRVQTPTRQRRAASATPAELTPSRVRARKESKSPSRKFATTSSEGTSSSVAKSPTRRTPTRSMTKSMLVEVEQESSKRESTRPKAAKALYEKFTVTKPPLRGLDARTLFDMSATGTSSRHRTLSDSEVPEVEEKRRRTNRIVSTIVEVEDESGSVSSRSSKGGGGRNVVEIPATLKAQSPSRQRRAASATPVELTPSRTRTRKASDSAVSLAPATPKSASRRGRSSKIQPIPE